MGSCSCSKRSTFEPINGLRVLGFQTTWLFLLVHLANICAESEVFPCRRLPYAAQFALMDAEPLHSRQ
jgi:hypothetical protein